MGIVGRPIQMHSLRINIGTDVKLRSIYCVVIGLICISQCIILIFRYASLMASTIAVNIVVLILAL